MLLRLRIIAAGAVLALLVCASPASARIIEIGGAARGHADVPVDPVPGGVAHDRLPGQGRRQPQRTYIVPADGRIVAWTIALGKPDKRQIDFFDSNFGEA